MNNGTGITALALVCTLYAGAVYWMKHDVEQMLARPTASAARPVLTINEALAQIEAEQNMKRLKDQQALEDLVKNPPSNVLGGPGSTAREAVGVWVDPATGCHYITGGGTSPTYTVRLSKSGHPMCIGIND